MNLQDGFPLALEALKTAVSGESSVATREHFARFLKGPDTATHG